MRECTSEKKKESALRAKKEMRKKESALRAKKELNKKEKKHIAREKKLQKATCANISLINQKEAIHASARHKN